MSYAFPDTFSAYGAYFHTTGGFAQISQSQIDAVRKAFHSFLEGRAGPKDTVIISIASHGTVDNHGAYIMTYDSDPNDFAKTALPMAEVHSLVENAIKKVGHVILLADVCRAATIAGTKTDSFSSRAHTP